MSIETIERLPYQRLKMSDKMSIRLSSTYTWNNTFSIVSICQSTFQKKKGTTDINVAIGTYNSDTFNFDVVSSRNEFATAESWDLEAKLLANSHSSGQKRKIFARDNVFYVAIRR
jgi:hypothetical protein